MLITRNRRWQSGARKRTVGRELKFGPVSMKFATLTLLAIAALFYLAQSTQASAQKYQIMQLTSSKQELESKTKELEVEAARLKSLNEIKKSTQNDNLEPVDQAIFFQSKQKNT